MVGFSFFRSQSLGEVGPLTQTGTTLVFVLPTIIPIPKTVGFRIRTPAFSLYNSPFQVDPPSTAKHSHSFCLRSCIERSRTFRLLPFRFTVRHLRSRRKGIHSTRLSLGKFQVRYSIGFTKTSRKMMEKNHQGNNERL